MLELRQDLVYALRMVTRRPGFLAAALTALGLGIGATTATFSLVNAVALRPLPYRDPDRIVRVWETRPGLPGGARAAGFSIDHFRDWREKNRSFEQLAAYQGQAVTLTGVEEPCSSPGYASHRRSSLCWGRPRFWGGHSSPRRKSRARSESPC